MPVSWLKLLGFSFGAAVAAFTGTLFASQSASVFPLAFYFVLLITMYTMVMLGGSGSQAGVVLGAVIIGPLLEMLRDPGSRGSCSSWPWSVACSWLSACHGGWRSSGGRRSLSDSRFTGWPARSDRRWVAGEKAGGFQGAIDHWVVTPESSGALDSAVLVRRRDRGNPALDARPPAGCALSFCRRRSTWPRSSGRT